MKVLIRKARIIDPNSSYHHTTKDVLVDTGIISDISESIRNNEADKIIEGNDLHLSPGWVDIFSNFADPGFEHKETLQSGAEAAAAGGYTDVFVIPNTKPVTDSKSQVEYISRRGNHPATIHALGAISKNTDGRDLAEMYDMRNSGAIAFSDGIHPVQSAGLLLKALQYVKAFNGVIIQIPDDKSVGAHGLMHEGIVSTRLGLAGKPMMAEELLVARDIKLARYATSRLHFTGITSPKSLDYIRRAKEGGIDVTCSVTPYHLFFTDEDLMGYDTNLKVYPPLRPAAEQKALQKAVEDGTIDCIATHHMPQDYDNKVVEFEYAKNGMIGLQTSYAALKTVMPGISESRWVELLSINPRKIFGMPSSTIDKQSAASLTIFTPSASTQVEGGFFRSKSKNSPFIGKTLNGKVVGVINGEKLSLNQ